MPAWDEIAKQVYNDEMKMSDICRLQAYESLEYLIPDKNTEIRLPSTTEIEQAKEFRAPWK